MNINEEKWIDEFTDKAEEAMSENYEFEFTEVSDDMTGIRIKGGDFDGLHWTFGTVSFEEMDNGEMKCHFDYKIHDNPNDVPEVGKELIDFMGDVLVEVLDVELGEEDHVDLEDVPLPPEDIANQMINTKVATDFVREKNEQLNDQQDDEH